MDARGFRLLLGEDRWHALLARGAERRFRRGEPLLRQGEPGTTVLALRCGRVKVLGAEEDGRQLLITMRGQGDLVGEIAAKSGGARTATVVAIDDCSTRSLTWREFCAFLDECGGHPTLLDYALSKLSQTVPYQLRLAHFGPELRIARLLLEVVALVDESAADPTRVPFSQQEVADALSMSRSTVALHLQQLRDAGALGPGPRLAVLDLTTLRSAAGV